MCLQKLTKYHDTFYAIMRIVAGVVFTMHGLMKFGVIPGMAQLPAMYSEFWFAGCIEVVAGIAITLGIFTRCAALIATIEMAVAYLYIHARTGGLNPLANGGEAAVLFFVIWLLVTSHGAVKWSVEKALFKKEHC